MVIILFVTVDTLSVVVVETQLVGDLMMRISLSFILKIFTKHFGRTVDRVD